MALLMLLDGNSLTYRAFFALPTTMATASGQVTNAVYGFTSMLVNLIKEHHPDQLVVAFDRPEPTFRHEMIPSYKANRSEAPDILRQQMGLVRQLVDTMQIPVVEAPGFEADDVLATLATKAAVAGDDVHEVLDAGKVEHLHFVAGLLEHRGGKQLLDVKDILICDPWAGDGGSGSRLAWGPHGMLYMTTGASNGNAAQEGTSLRGKILRLKDDGTAASGNPFAGKPGYKAEIYSMGHRNSLGLAFNPFTGDLWNNENGPYGGDEINIIKPGLNYGWPKTSYGRDYSGPKIVNTAPGMTEPLIFWAPSIAPSGMMFYTGDRFPDWKRNVFVGAMLGGAAQGYPHLERITFNENWDETARQSLLTDLKQRIRDVRQGPDGLVYVLTDEENGSLIRLEPAQ